jgi:hypothetical protein
VLVSCAPLDEPEAEPVPARDSTPALLPAGLPTTAELSASPRADVRAEVAALVVDRARWLASEQAYARVVEDFAAIERELPAVVFGIGDNARATTGVYGALVYAPGDDDVAAANAAALKTVANVANALGGQVLDAGDANFSAQWPARLQPAFVDEVFSSIDGVAHAYPGADGVQDGPRVEVEQFAVDGKNVWLLLNFGGDCPEGCTELEASRVRVERNGASLRVDLLGSFSTGEACPEWLAVLEGVCERYAAP